MPFKDAEKQKEYFKGYNAKRREKMRDYNKSRYKKNKKTQLAKQKKKYWENRDAIITAKREDRKNNPDKHRRWANSWGANNPKKTMFNSARSRAKKLGLLFDITIEDIHIPDECPVFSTPFGKGGRYARDNSMTLDRKNTALGYVPGNVFVISWRANRLKSNGTLDDFKKIIEYLVGEA